MRSILVSDAHLRDLDDPNQDRLVRFLRGCEADELVLVGDIFDVWWGWDRAVYSAFIPMCNALYELRRRGLRVVWVGGNHDFDAGPVIANELGIEVGEVWRGTSRGRRVMAVHGDRADLTLGNRLLTRVVRGRVAAGLMRLLGPGRGWAASRRLSGHSRMSGGSDLAPLLDAQRTLADGLLGVQADVVCMGHSHAPGREARARGELVNLGDWVDHHTYAIVEREVELFAWNDGYPKPLTDGMRRRAE